MQCGNFGYQFGSHRTVVTAAGLTAESLAYAGKPAALWCKLIKPLLSLSSNQIKIDQRFPYLSQTTKVYTPY